jgi:hypothetical protein
MPTPGGLGRRGSLCHEHQCNLPQVRDATAFESLLCCLSGTASRTVYRDLEPTGKVFFLHSRWTGKLQVRHVSARLLRACSQGCPPCRAQVLRSSPQREALHPHRLWITRLAEGAEGPTVVRRPPRFQASETSSTDASEPESGPHICQCRAVRKRARRGPPGGLEEVAR